MHHSEPLLKLKKAAELLGVHPATLRRWADNGDIICVFTPGGHRRFPRSEVERLAQLNNHAVPERKEFSIQLEQKALQHTRAEISEHRGEGWMQSFDERMKEEQRQLGRRVMGLMMRYISVEDAGKDLLKEAQTIGHTYAEVSQKFSLSLSQTIQAMMFFRENIVESLVVLPESLQNRNQSSKVLLRRVNTFLNAILLGVTEAYENN